MMHKRLLAIAGACAVLPIALLSGGTANAASGPTVHGCPYGAVCVYPAGTGWNGDSPKYEFFSYAGHNIFNEFGTNRVLDNQYGGHAVGLCAGSDGTGGPVFESSSTEGSTAYFPVYWDANLYPVNSLDLRPFSQYNSLCER